MEIYDFPLDIVDEIPNEMPKFVKNMFDPAYFANGNMTKEMHLKEVYNSQGMFAFVSWKWINPLVEWIGKRKCLEVMAGRGWLSYALRQKGVDVISTDNFSWSNERGWKEPLTEVIEADAIESINLFGDKVDLVFLGWPYMDDTAYKTIKRLHEVNPHAQVIYIGEGGGGCTANDDFFNHFELVDDKKFWENVSPNYERWNMLHDHLELGRYKKEEQ